MEIITIASGAFLFGLVIGSFLNVVIHRVPLEESVVFPGSRCPSCRAPIRPLDNIPLVSYALLRGRCRNCGGSIPASYPLVELLTGAVFALSALKCGPGWEALLEMAFASAMISLVFIDARHHLIPNVITYPMIVLSLAAAAAREGWGDPNPSALGFSIIFERPDYAFPALRASLIGAAAIAMAAPAFRLIDKLDLLLFNKYFEWEEEEIEEEPGDGDRVAGDPEPGQRSVILASVGAGFLVAAAWVLAVTLLSARDTRPFDDAYDGLLSGVAGALIGGGLIWVLRAFYFYARGIEGIGLGDVKMIAVIGAFLGWQSMFGVLLIGSILGTAVGITLSLRARRGLRTPLPFGACLGIAAILVLFLSRPFVAWRMLSGQ